MPKTGIAHFAVKTSSQILPVAISGRFKLFGKIRIVVGEPFRLDADSKKKYQHEELLELSILVMKRVYDLIGFEYNPGKGDV
jgi:1-acyl-sn-glycerol-3-phosphate acyltransferase